MFICRGKTDPGFVVADLKACSTNRDRRVTSTALNGERNFKRGLFCEIRDINLKAGSNISLGGDCVITPAWSTPLETESTCISTPRLGRGLSIAYIFQSSAMVVSIRNTRSVSDSPAST